MRKFLGLAAVVVLTGVGSTGGAQAGQDNIAPSLTAPPYAKFVVGQQLEDYYLSPVDEVVRWKAADNPGGTGLRHVRVFERYSEGAADHYERVYSGLGSRTTVIGRPNFPFTCSSYLQLHHQVRATDWAGNRAVDNVGTVPRIVDQDGNVYPADEPAPDDAWEWFTVEQTGTWGVSNFDGWLYGTTYRTYQAGAAVTYTRSFQAGQHVGIVMPKGPDRGEASILIDGNLKGSVDTYSPLRTHRILIFETPMTAGTHSISIVNMGTSQHSRIDVDALVVNDYGGAC